MRRLLLPAVLSLPGAASAATGEDFAGLWAKDEAACASPAVTFAPVSFDHPDAAGKTLLQMTTTHAGRPIEKRYVYKGEYKLDHGVQLADGNMQFLFFEPDGGKLAFSYKAVGGPKKDTFGGLELKDGKPVKLVRCPGTAVVTVHLSPPATTPRSPEAAASSVAATPAPPAAPSPPPEEALGTLAGPPAIPVSPRTADGLAAALETYRKTFGPSWLMGSFGAVNHGDWVARDEQGTPGTSIFAHGCWIQASSYLTTHPRGPSAQAFPPQRWTTPDGAELSPEGELTFYTGKDGRRYLLLPSLTTFEAPVPVEVESRGGKLLVRSGKETLLTVTLEGVLYGHPDDVRTPWLDGYRHNLWVEDIRARAPGNIDATYFLLAFTDPDGTTKYRTACQTGIW